MDNALVITPQIAYRVHILNGSYIEDRIVMFTYHILATFCQRRFTVITLSPPKSVYLSYKYVHTYFLKYVHTVLLVARPLTSILCFDTH